MEETTSPNKERLIKELVSGRDSTKKLQNLLRRKLYDDGSVSAEDLVMNILGSFSDSLSVLRSGDLCLDPATTSVEYSDDPTWDSSETEKKLAPVVKDRRGCYKRKKTEDSRVKIVDTIEDGYAWRKYGQKNILCAKFPRCYFRCTHKNEGCKALKQVQKLEDGSEMFHVTYFGHHTCQNMYKKNTHMFSDSGDLSVFLLKFEDSKIKHPPSSPSTITNAHITQSLEQEDDSYAQSDYLLSRNYGHSTNALWKDIIGNWEPFHEDSIKNSAYYKFDEDLIL